MLINGPKIRLSRRGAFLFVFGMLYILTGISYLILSPAQIVEVRASLHYLVQLAPPFVLGILWITCGTLAMLSAIWRQFDWLGFGAAIFLPVVWGLGTALNPIAHPPNLSWVLSVVSCLIFVALALSIWLVAGMADPRDLDVRRVKRDRGRKT